MRRLRGVKPVQRRREEDERGRGLCLCSTAQSACGLVAVCVRELRDEEREAEV